MNIWTYTTDDRLQTAVPVFIFMSITMLMHLQMNHQSLF